MRYIAVNSCLVGIVGGALLLMLWESVLGVSILHWAWPTIGIACTLWVVYCLDRELQSYLDTVRGLLLQTEGLVSRIRAKEEARDQSNREA